MIAGTQTLQEIKCTTTRPGQFQDSRQKTIKRNTTDGATENSEAPRTITSTKQLQCQARSATLRRATFDRSYSPTAPLTLHTCRKRKKSRSRKSRLNLINFFASKKTKKEKNLNPKTLHCPIVTSVRRYMQHYGAVMMTSLPSGQSESAIPTSTSHYKHFAQLTLHLKYVPPPIFFTVHPTLTYCQ